ETLVLAEVRTWFTDKLEPLKKIYPYVSCPDFRYCGVVVYSRVPLTRWPGSAEDPGMVGATMHYPEGDLSLVAVHMTRPWPFKPRHDQPLEIEGIAARTKEAAGPKLVVGDFNAVPWGAIVRRMSAVANVKALPSRGTWHAAMPFPLRLPIDEALVDGLPCAS